MDLGVKSPPNTSPTASWKSGDVIAGHFPAGLKVLVVDDDPTCLRILEKMLKKCLYEVTTCNRAEVALNFLRDSKSGFEIVISDVHMPDMDGFKVLEHVGLEMDLPVIMMSVDESKHVVMKGVTHGACDYLIKPVSIEALKNIWQHVVRKKKQEWKDKDLEHSGSVEEGERQQKPLEDVDCSSSVSKANRRNSKKRKYEEDGVEDRGDTSTSKKPRVVWSVELHRQFVTAVNQLEIDKAGPKKILELMNVPGLTRENISSHLQKYRLYLRRLVGLSQHQNGLGNSFMGSSDAPFGSMSALNGVDLQALAASGQMPSQSLASIQAATVGRATTNSSITLPHVEHVLSQAIPSDGLGRNGIENNLGPQCTLISQPSTSADFSSQNTEFSGNSCPVESNTGTRGSRCCLPRNVNQNMNQDWHWHNVGSTVMPSNMQQQLSCVPSANKASSLMHEEGYGNMSQLLNLSEEVPEMGLLFGQEDFVKPLSELCLLQQEGFENEFGFHLDDLPV